MVHDPFQNKNWFSEVTYWSPHLRLVVSAGQGGGGVAVQSFSRVRLSATAWTAACQASLSFTVSQSLLKLMSIESMMPYNHLLLCRPLLLLPSIFPSFRVRVYPKAAVICSLAWWERSHLQHGLVPAFSTLDGYHVVTCA